MRGSGAIYEGRTITEATEITRFQACLSFLILTTRFPSRFLFAEQGNLFSIGSTYTIVTLLLGWWGIPWGPVYTIQTLYQNLRGGQKQTISEILKTMEKAAAATLPGAAPAA